MYADTMRTFLGRSSRLVTFVNSEIRRVKFIMVDFDEKIEKKGRKKRKLLNCSSNFPDLRSKCVYECARVEVETAGFGQTCDISPIYCYPLMSP